MKIDNHLASTGCVRRRPQSMVIDAVGSDETAGCCQRAGLRYFQRIDLLLFELLFEMTVSLSYVIMFANYL
jgi:hypothetical protein